MDEKPVAAFNALPQPSSCRLIDFDDVQVVPGTVLRTYFLIVKGTKPWMTMDVGLHPLPYASRPDYTAIEVVGCQNGIGLPKAGPYSAVIEFTHLIGVRGIEVIGASDQGGSTRWRSTQRNEQNGNGPPSSVGRQC